MSPRLFGNPASESKLRMPSLPAVIKEPYGRRAGGGSAVVSHPDVWRRLGGPQEVNTAASGWKNKYLEEFLQPLV